MGHYLTPRINPPRIGCAHGKNKYVAGSQKCAKLYRVELLIIFAVLVPVIVGVGSVVALDRPIEEPKTIEAPAAPEPELATVPAEEPVEVQEPVAEPTS